MLRVVRQPTRVLNKQKKAVQQLLHGLDVHMPITPVASEYCFRITSKMGFPRTLAMKISRTAGRLHKYTHMRARSCASVVAISIIFGAERSGMPLDAQTLCTVCDVTYPTLCKWYSDATDRSVAESKEIVSELWQMHTSITGV